MISINVFSEEKAWSKRLKNKDIFFKQICKAFPKKYKFLNKKVSLTLLLSNNKNIKKLNDFADLSSDELIGGYDELKGKKIRIDGYLEEFSLSRKEADDLIMAAREIAYN